MDCYGLCGLDYTLFSIDKYNSNFYIIYSIYNFIQFPPALKHNKQAKCIDTLNSDVSLANVSVQNIQLTVFIFSQFWQVTGYNDKPRWWQVISAVNDA